MAMKLLVARDRGNGLFFRVHLDDTKFGADGTTPDPAWVAEFSWPRTNSPRTAAQHLADVKRETKALCQEKLAALQAATQGTALAGEGQVF